VKIAPSPPGFRFAQRYFQGSKKTFCAALRSHAPSKRTADGNSIPRRAKPSPAWRELIEDGPASPKPVAQNRRCEDRRVIADAENGKNPSPRQES
jgi:hypothetical protein